MGNPLRSGVISLIDLLAPLGDWSLSLGRTFNDLRDDLPAGSTLLGNIEGVKKWRISNVLLVTSVLPWQPVNNPNGCHGNLSLALLTIIVGKTGLK